MTEAYPVPRDDAPLVVFDFDHTLYDGDSGSHLFAWLIKRNPLRLLVALLASPILGPMVAMLPTAAAACPGMCGSPPSACTARASSTVSLMPTCSSMRRRSGSACCRTP